MTERPSQPTASPALALDSVDAASDDFGRAIFAQHLLNLTIAVDAVTGAVIGLEGEWGTGKTWVLRRAEVLNRSADITTRPFFVWFNPWMVSGKSEIVEAFLIQLAGELAAGSGEPGLQSGAQIAEKLIDYTRVLSTVKHLAPLANILLPGTGLLFEAVGTAAGTATSAAQDSLGPALDRWKKSPDKLSIAKARQQVIELLQRSERRIVVVIDDLDRLPPADLAAMIQAVKSVADFPNVVYVLSYDPKTAAHGLKKALDLRPGEGSRYLEKIVQLPLPLPALPAFRIQTHAKAALSDVMKSRNRTQAMRAMHRTSTTRCRWLPP